MLLDGLGGEVDDLHDQVGEDDEELQGAESRLVCLSCLDYNDLLGEMVSGVMHCLANTVSSS